MPVTPETVGSVGEFPLIERITSGLAMGPAVSVGPGDDAAVFLVNGSAVTQRSCSGVPMPTRIISG